MKALNMIKKITVGLFISLFITGLIGKERAGSQLDLGKLDGGKFDANRINTDISNTGFIVDYHPTGHSGMEWPKGSGNYSNFQSGVWFAGKVNNAIRTATAEYSTEFTPGEYGAESSADEYQLYTVNKSDLADPLASDDFQNWPAHRGAPWVDNDGDGIYSPLPNGPDHPDFIGDQVTFYTMTDGDPGSHVLYGTAPLGIEVRVTIWGYDRPDAFGDMMFVKTQAYNMSGEDITDMLVGIWDDPDLGDAGDDFVGCDIDLSLGICFNDGPDAYYGDAAPAMGYDFFQATVPGGDSSAFGFGQILDGYQNLPMSSFVKYINGDAVYYDPETADEVYNYMSGYKADGTPFVNSETGEDSKFVHPCDPNDDAGPGDGCWVDSDDHDSGDRRFLMNVGPFTFPAGDSLEVVFGIIHAQASDPLSSITLLKEVDQLAQLAYDIQFALPESPPQPNVTATSSFEEIILTWDDIAESYSAIDEIDLDENGNPSSFEFEGYNVWQHESADGTGSKKLLATFDVVNGVTEIFDDVFDPNYGSSVNVAVQSGSDSGLQRWLRIFRDDLNGGSPLENNREYFFTVNAYGYNAIGIPKTLESSDNIFGIRPHSHVDVTPGAEFGYSDFEVTHTGTSDGSISVKVIDPYLVTGHDYEVYLDSFYVDWETGVELGYAEGPDCAGQYVMAGDDSLNVLDCSGNCFPAEMISSAAGDCNCDDGAIDSTGVAGMDLNCSDYEYDNNDCFDCSGYRVTMIDAYGDGWNGAVLTIGTETFELPDGAEAYGCYEGPVDVVVTCSSGDWPTEVSWVIADPECNEVLSGGAPYDGCLGDCGGDVIGQNTPKNANNSQSSQYRQGQVSIKVKPKNPKNPYGLNLKSNQYHNDYLLRSGSIADYDPNGFLFLGWNLLDITTGETILENQTIQGGFDNLTNNDAGVTAQVVDGLEVVVNGPSNGIHGIYMVHDGVNSTEANSDAPGLSVLQEHVWQNYDGVLAWSANSNGGYYFATQGGGEAASEASYYDRVFRDDNFTRAIPHDFEMRFTENGGVCLDPPNWGGTEDLMSVPFELWNVGDLSNPADDYRMVCYIFDVDGSASYNWWGDLEDSGAENDPGTDWIYWANPVDMTPGTSGYEAFENGGGVEDHVGGEVMARTVWNNWNGYGSTADSLALSELSSPDPANWTAADTTLFTDRGWFFDSVNSLAGVSVSGDHAYGLIINFPAEGSVYRWITNKPNTVNDSFTFSTSSVAGTETAYDCESANVWPNPYFAENPEENGTFDYQVHFTGLNPAGTTISIYNLTGLLVDKFSSNEQNAIWDLRNSHDIPVASGMYIAMVDGGNCQQIIKLAVVARQQRLDRY